MDDKEKAKKAKACCSIFSLGCIAVFWLLFVGVVTAGWFGIDIGYRHDLVLLDHGLPATGTTVEVREDHGRRRCGTKLTSVVEYAVKGETFRDYYDTCMSQPRYALGEEVPLLYDPDEPEYARPASIISEEKINRWRNISYVAMSVFTALTVLSVIVTIIKAKKKSRR